MTSSSDLPKVIDNTNGTLPVHDQSGTATQLHEHVYGAAAGTGFNDSYKQAVGRIMQADGNSADKVLGAASVGDAANSINSDVAYFKFPEPTDSERKEAIKKLDDEVSNLIPKDEQKLLKSMHDHLINGDTKGLAQDLATLKKTHPDQFNDVIKEMDKELSAAHAGVSMTVDSKGNVLVYNDSGSQALSINPSDGSTCVRPIHVQMDGSVVLDPGEVLKGDAGKVAKDIGDQATRGSNDSWLKMIGKGIFDPDTAWNPWEQLQKPGWTDPGFVPHIHPDDPGMSPKFPINDGKQNPHIILMDSKMQEQ